MLLIIASKLRQGTLDSLLVEIVRIKNDSTNFLLPLLNCVEFYTFYSVRLYVLITILAPTIDNFTVGCTECNVTVKYR